MAAGRTSPALSTTISRYSLEFETRGHSKYGRYPAAMSSQDYDYENTTGASRIVFEKKVGRCSNISKFFVETQACGSL